MLEKPFWALRSELFPQQNHEKEYILIVLCSYLWNGVYFGGGFSHQKLMELLVLVGISVDSVLNLPGDGVAVSSLQHSRLILIIFSFCCMS